MGPQPASVPNLLIYSSLCILLIFPLLPNDVVVIKRGIFHILCVCGSDGIKDSACWDPIDSHSWVKKRIKKMSKKLGSVSRPHPALNCRLEDSEGASRMLHGGSCTTIYHIYFIVIFLQKSLIANSRNIICL